ncbi:hypothetical protein ACS5PN_26955 [Roseateles sp. NT4]|uniref:hypothetical protein n=1 Tax=Roseateles sp. NT4 TaxID=3453715 RepID=UPI003EEFF7BE
MKPALSLAFLSILSFLAGAAHASEVYAGYGTSGLQLGFGKALTPSFGVRAEANLQSLGQHWSSDDTRYQVRLKLQRVALLGDLRAAGNFRLTAGVFLGSSSVNGEAQTQSGTIKINGHDYAAAGESLTLKARFPQASPYLGIGGGHFAERGISFHYDLGAAFGRPKVALTASPGLLAAAGQANLDAEQSSAQRSANHWKAFPVLRGGFSYSF